MIAGLRNLVTQNPKVVHDRTQIGINALGELGIEVGLACYLDTRTAAEERDAKEGLLMGVLWLAERLGIKLGAGSREIDREGGQRRARAGHEGARLAAET